MNNTEKVKRLQSLCQEMKHVDCFYKDLEDMGDLKINYYDYMTTVPINCDEELKRLPDADYEICTAFINHDSQRGPFQQRLIYEEI